MSTIQQAPIDSIIETPENWEIYHRPGIEAEFLALIESIKSEGITHPLLVSIDDYIVSRHRRYLAAINASLSHVPIIRLDVEMKPLSPSDRIKILIEHNRGTRHKTATEAAREVMAQIDPQAAVDDAQNRRAQHLIKIESSFSFIEARGRIARSSTQGARSEIMAAVIEIIEESNRRGFLPMSIRGIHYQLLQRKVKTSSYSNSHIYGENWKIDKNGNRKLVDSSPFLSTLITDARHEGIIEDGWISDETRPFYLQRLWDSPSDCLQDEINRLLLGYFTNPHRDQDSHIEIMVEKNTIFPLIRDHVALPMRLPINSCRGYSSGSQRARVVERYHKSGKRHLTIIYAGDHDPDGIEMPKALVKYMEADLGVKPRVIRAAVNTEQIERFKLLPDMRAKESSTRFDAYLKETKMRDAWEIDSMDPSDLVSEMIKACHSVIDIEVFNDAMEQEKNDDVRLAKLRAVILKAIDQNAPILDQ